MEPKRFQIGEQFYWNDTLYRIRAIDQDGMIEIEDAVRNIRVVPWRHLMQALFDHQLERVISGKQAKPGQNGKLSTARLYPDFNDAPPHLQREAELREKFILPLVDLPSRQRTDQRIEERIAEIKTEGTKEAWPKAELDILGDLSVRTTRRWLKDYREGDRDRMALLSHIGRRGGLNQHKLNSQVEALLELTIHEKKKHQPAKTVDDVRDEVATKIEHLNDSLPADEQLKTPAKGTIIARIRKMGLEKHFGLPSSKGKPSSRPHPGGRNARAFIPGEMYYMDTTTQDLITIGADYLPVGRGDLVFTLDDATASAAGRYGGFEKSYLGIAECLYHTILPKAPIIGDEGQVWQWLACGIPREIVVDNGKVYISKAFRDACDSLNITLTNAPVRNPEFKAAMERHFRTMDTKLIHKLPGTTFSSIVQRGSYDSMRNACIMADDFERILDIGIVGIYANSQHRGLDGDTPDQRWREATSTGWLPRLPNSAEDLTIATGLMFFPTLFHYGFDIKLIRYNGPDLHVLKKRFLGKRLKVKVPPGDLSRAYVMGVVGDNGRLDRDEAVDFPILVPARDDEDYTRNLSMWKHNVIRRYVAEQRQKPSLAVLGRAKRDLQKIVADSMHDMSTAVRGRATRFTNTPPSLREPADRAQLLAGQAAEPSAPQIPSTLPEEPPAEGGDNLSFDGPPADWIDQ